MKMEIAVDVIFPDGSNLHFPFDDPQAGLALFQIVQHNPKAFGSDTAQVHLTMVADLTTNSKTD